MFTQLGISIFELYEEISYNTLINIILTVTTWIITFTISVPLHAKIESNVSIEESVNKLIKSNWIRTIIWNAIFFFDMFQYIFK